MIRELLSILAISNGIYDREGGTALTVWIDDRTDLPALPSAVFRLRQPTPNCHQDLHGGLLLGRFAAGQECHAPTVFR